VNLHHINLTTPDVGMMRSFYRDVLGLEDAEGAQERIGSAYDLPGAFVQDAGGRQIHLSKTNPDLLFRTGREVNMLGPNGHIAFRVDDIRALMHKLDAAAVPYADYGEWAIKGWYQIFLHDPMGNVLEFHQVDPGH
jgi:catechol 2,3-dioxygenase-like lactoylglutathione lyase family enzyme